MITEDYPSVEDIMDLIEMVRFVEGFERERDTERLQDLSKNGQSEKGIPITYHFTILEAAKA